MSKEKVHDRNEIGILKLLADVRYRGMALYCRCQAKSNDHAKSNDLAVSEQFSLDFVRGYKYCVTYRMRTL